VTAAVLHEMTPLMRFAAVVVLLAALALIGIIAAGIVLWFRGFRTITIGDPGPFGEHHRVPPDGHAEQSLDVARPERDR
jgi:uncharacterized iron-regulated membrane protein